MVLSFCGMGRTLTPSLSLPAGANGLRPLNAIDIRLAGGAVKSAVPVKAANAEFLPAVDMVDLDGKRFNFAQLNGQPIVVEFWATWCPICLHTLKWNKRITRSIGPCRRSGRRLRTERHSGSHPENPTACESRHRIAGAAHGVLGTAGRSDAVDRRCQRKNRQDVLRSATGPARSDRKRAREVAMK